MSKFLDKFGIVLINKSFIVGMVFGLVITIILLTPLRLIEDYAAQQLFWFSGSWVLWSFFVNIPEILTGIKVPVMMFNTLLVMLLPITYGFVFRYGTSHVYRAIIIFVLFYLNYKFIMLGFGAMH
ncbi:hypothetical protein H6770_00245 [Candidatus Peribacteria bacterium]|nr:hypothetical protein [Candidatus Peribacteria bacterium]